MIDDSHNNGPKFGLTYIVVDCIEVLRANDDSESPTATDDLVQLIKKTSQVSSRIKCLVSVDLKQLSIVDDTGTNMVKSMTLEKIR